MEQETAYPPVIRKDLGVAVQHNGSASRTGLNKVNAANRTEMIHCVATGDCKYVYNEAPTAWELVKRPLPALTEQNGPVACRAVSHP